MRILTTLLLILLLQMSYAQEKLSFIRPGDVLQGRYEYTGEVKDGKANGYGEAKCSYNSYKGYWKDNNFHGKGILSNETGIEYEGEFVEGKIWGKGTRYYPGGVKYTGEFIDGYQTGWGKKIYPDGKIEEGYFLRNEFKGSTPPPGLDEAKRIPGLKMESLVFSIPYPKNTDLQLWISYTGEVKDGKANGYGEANISITGGYSGTKPFASYKGYWKDNTYNGKGTLDFIAGSKYEGEFLNGQPHGKGVYTYEGGGSYTGDFAYGKREGKGVMIYSDGSKEEGNWGGDQFRGNGSKIPDQYVSANPSTGGNSGNGQTNTKTASSHSSTEMFYATEKDYANVDWEALGRAKPAPGYTTGQQIAFLEEVSKDVRKYLDQTYSKNGNTYKRYRRSKEVDGNTYVHSGQVVPLTGKTTPVLILAYCQNFKDEAKAKVIINYDGNGQKTDNKTVLTGASCNVITECGNQICKTSCTGAIEVNVAYSSQALWLERKGNWNGMEKVYWVVLADNKQ